MSLLTQPGGMLQLYDELREHPDLPFAVDTETTWSDSLIDRQLIGVSVAIRTPDEEGDKQAITYYIPINHHSGLFGNENYEGDWPIDIFSVPGKPLAMHNAKFDLQMLDQLGLKVDTDSLFDTMLMHHYIDEYPPHGLKELGKLLLGREDSKELKDGMARLRKSADNKQEAIPAMGMALYAEQDALMTLELFEYLKDEFYVYSEIWKQIDRPFMLLLKEMELKGLRVDKSLASELSKAAQLREAEIRTLLGFDPASPKALMRKLFEIPPIGLGLVPQRRGKSGRPSMDEAYLTSVGHPLTALVLEYRGLVKARSSYFDAYGRLASRQNARIHPTFKQHGTLTGRLSCADPNLQQIPRDSEVKKLFLPDEDCELWEFDYRNIEMRLAAVYAEEQVMLETFRAEGDVHQLVADQLEIDRQSAKVINFLILYGGGKNKLAQQLRIKATDAEKILSNYRETYPGLFEIAIRATNTAEANGFVKNWGARRRHFKYPSEHHKAFNAIIQGGAFEIVKRSMLALGEAGYDLRLNVHDSVWINLPKGKDRQPIKSLMEDWTVDKFQLRFSVDEKKLR